MTNPIPLVSFYHGAVINPKNLTGCDKLPRAVIAVDRNGDILGVQNDVKKQDVQKVVDEMVSEYRAFHGCDVLVEITKLQDGEFVVPGFVDTHTHAPQFPNLGLGGDFELLEWLNKVTFPMEANFRNEDFAREVYPEAVRRFIAFGSTTCRYYATSHLDSTKVLADVVLRSGQRAFVGKCNMDDKGVPEPVREPSVEVALKETVEIISYIRSLKSDLVCPIITPRFAIGCTEELLHELAKIVNIDKTLVIQTHISENKPEVKNTLERFEDDSYAHVYERFGLLSERTILAHGVYLEEKELEIIKKRGAGVGLGTDVSGGFAPSMLAGVQHASMCSGMVALQNPKGSPSGFEGKLLPAETLIYLATLGGAALCCMEDKIGSFAPGKSFDALVVSVRPETGNPAIWNLQNDFRRPMNEEGTGQRGGKDDKEILATRLERFLFGGDDRNIRKVFIAGRCIGGKNFHPYSDVQKANS